MAHLNAKNKTLIGYIIIGVSMSVFIILLLTAFALKREPCDPVTFCPLNVACPHTVIVIDKTDPLSAAHQRFIIDYINKTKDRLADFERLSIFTLNEDAYLAPEPVFSKCNPGIGEGANRLYQNPKKLRMKFDMFFSQPLKDVLNNALSDNTDTKSPILEMIRELSFREDFSDNVPERNLIIISDMMHHTSGYSLYRCRADYRCFATTSYAEEIASNLDSANVKIIYLLRDNLNSIQGKRHLAFWEDYFQAMGARVTEVRKVR